MKISIITICYNNETEIADTIESVLSQTYPAIEYIVIDGASKDNTLKIANRYADKISKIISEPDRGIYDAINKGIRAATGEVLGLIHAGDALYDTTVIEKIANHFKTHDIEAMYGHSKIFTADGQKVVRVNKSPEYRDELFKRGWFPSHQSFYAKRKLFERFGDYNLKYRIAADYELLFRFMFLHKIKVKRLDEFIVKFKLGGTSTKSIRNIIRLNQECAQAWKDNGLRIPFYTIPLKLGRKINQLIAAKLS